MTMDPQLLFRGAEPDHENVGGRLGDEPEDPLILLLIMFEAQRRTVGPDNSNVRPAVVNTVCGSIGDTRCTRSTNASDNPR